jgi:hypothetical protein
MTSRDYELLIREIFQDLLDQDRVPNILVEHDVVKQGLKTAHQIDVYWEFALAGVKYRTVVQAKNWTKPVDQGELLKFESVLADIPGKPLGIMVTAAGYQKGALDVANTSGIWIYELRPESPPTLTMNHTGHARVAIKGLCKNVSGKPFGMILDAEVVNPEFSDLVFHVDSAWAQDNSGGGLPPPSHLQFQSHELHFYDAEHLFLRTLRDIYSDLAKEIAGRSDVSAQHAHTFEGPTFLKSPLSSLIKVTGFSVKVNLKIEHQQMLCPLVNVSTFILNRINDGKTWKVVQTPD